MYKNLFPIAKEGFKTIGIVSVVFALCAMLDLEFLSYIAFAILLALVYLYRNPEREVPSFEADSLVSPCDGLVLSITTLEDSEYTYKIEIENKLNNVSILRAPFAAKIIKFEKQNGTNLPQSSKLFTAINENISILLASPSKNTIKVTHRITRSCMPIAVDLTQGQNLIQSSRYGVLTNGITSIYLPANFRHNLNVGNELRASESLIGYFS